MGGRGANSMARIVRGATIASTTMNPTTGKTFSQVIQNAIGTQGAPMSMKQANVGTNPDYNKGDGYMINCQRCVLAYALRRRGYDVVARRGTRNDPLANGASKSGNFFHAMRNPNGGTFNGLVRYTTGGTHVTDIQKQMGNWGDGAIALISFARPGGAGHVFIAEQNRGQTIFLDPQVGRVVQPKTRGYLGGAASGTIRLFRLDNLDPTDLIAKCVKPAH